MDRITYTILDGKMENHGVKPEHIKEAVERLAAYEDTGLTPEEVKLMARREEWEPMVQITRIHGVPLNRLERLAQAEAEGRLIVLPCKVGDKLYEIFVDNDALDIKQKKIKAIAIDIDEYGGRTYDVKDEDGYWFYNNELGETAFLTRAAAEAALKEAQQR